jgi:alpha-tubulin suppressor-like RCC1 family protein
MGNNNKGQLGIETIKFRTRPSPTLVESLSSFQITSIAAGGDCSFAVTSSGSVFAWGDGHLGQLGLGNFMRTDVP